MEVRLDFTTVLTMLLFTLIANVICSEKASFKYSKDANTVLEEHGHDFNNDKDFRAFMDSNNYYNPDQKDDKEGDDEDEDEEDDGPEFISSEEELIRE